MGGRSPTPPWSTASERLKEIVELEMAFFPPTDLDPTMAPILKAQADLLERGEAPHF